MQATNVQNLFVVLQDGLPDELVMYMSEPCLEDDLWELQPTFSLTGLAMASKRYNRLLQPLLSEFCHDPESAQCPRMMWQGAQ